MSNRDIYEITAKLNQISDGDLNQGAGPKFVGYLRGTDPASDTRKKLVGDSAKDISLSREMSRIEKDREQELEKTMQSLLKDLEIQKKQHSIEEDIVVKGSAKDLKDFLDTVSKEKKIDTDLKSKDNNRGGDSLKPVDKISIGPNGEKIAQICGNMDDGFIIKVDNKEIGSGFKSIADAKQTIDKVHEQMMEQQPANVSQDYMEER